MRGFWGLRWLKGLGDLRGLLGLTELIWLQYIYCQMVRTPWKVEVFEGFDWVEGV